MGFLPVQCSEYAEVMQAGHDRKARGMMLWPTAIKTRQDTPVFEMPDVLLDLNALASHHEAVPEAA